ncbi:transposase, partial [Bacillus thuringiensis]|nr:transposase [Bacillus thuringiensis]
SSKQCSNCGEVNKHLTLSDRTYHCKCGHHIDRDLNASINLSRYQLVN